MQNFELQSNKERKDINILIEKLIEDLKRYDDEHSIGKWTGRGLASFFIGKMGGEEGVEKIQKEVSANLTINDLNKKNSIILKRIGLDLESPNKKGNIEENETYAIGNIKINIEDKSKFINFLKSINKNEISESQKELLKMIIKKIENQVRYEYDLGSPDDRLLELFSGLKEIINEYNRIGFEEDIKSLEYYNKHSNSGCFREYILAKNNNIFQPIGVGFNLSTYHIDSPGDYYEKRWEREVFKTLKEVKKNKSAKDLYKEILQYSLDCIKFAEEDLAKNLYNFSKEIIKERKKTIDDIKNRLEKLKEEEGKEE